MSHSALNDSINVTPLADVMLVLLIIFMVVTPMLGLGVDVGVPEAEYPEEHPGDEQTLVLSVGGDGTLFLNRAEIQERDLLAALSSRLASRTEKVLFLQANELLDYGRVLAVMDVCRRAGAEEVALITRERKSG
jgi:biopolymer transport protein ExbD